MECVLSRPDTPLQQHAQSLRQEGSGFSENFPMLFPMYTVPLDAALRMTTLKPHEELLAAGELSLFDDGLGKALFVSHQWVSQSYPDPEFKQFRVLQEALRNVTAGLSQISMDTITEAVFGLAKGISASEFRVSKLFLWYDFFSVPQVPLVLGEGGQCENIQQKAICSIPAYISRCQFFMALCPVIDSPDGSQVFSQVSWSGRGWCRVERAVRELSIHGGTWILVKSAKHQEIMAPLTLDPPGEGTFTVERDRAAVAPVLRHVLKAKLTTYLEQGDFTSYRILLNQQSARLRGLPTEPNDDLVPGFQAVPDAPKHQRAVAQFLHENGFCHPLERDAAGWSVLCYASMRGDPFLVQALLRCNADPNDKVTKAQPQLGVDKGTPVLGLCTKFKNHEAMKLLIAAGSRISVRGVLQTALSCACYVDDAEAVHCLCASGGDPNEKNPFGVSALRQACVTGSLHAMAALLEHTQNLDLSLSLHWVAMGQRSSAKALDLLIRARADVNEQYRPRRMSALGLFWRLKGLQYRAGWRSTQLRGVGYHHYGATPLMIAIICGNFEAAAALMVRGARLDLRNSRRRTAADLAREMSSPDYLIAALGGHMAWCNSLVVHALM